MRVISESLFCHNVHSQQQEKALITNDPLNSTRRATVFTKVLIRIFY